jgi:hypothetical protein
MDPQNENSERSTTSFEGELRRQLQTLTDGAGGRERRSRRRRLLIALAAGLLVAVVLGGIALAGGFDSVRDTFDPLRDTFWPQNEHGQTFGSAGVAKSYEDEPDLIAVASDGKRGYCYKADLDGPPPPTSPSAMDADEFNLPGMLGYAIPKYESDGTTQIGVFWIGGGGGGGGVMAGGARYETSADVHGTRITTTEDVDGSITIMREWLDGRTTVNSAADDPSLSRLPAAERPKKWREITLWFRDDAIERHGHTSSPSAAPDWLAEGMSAAARAAGDPGAVARWTVTYRRCAAPFEGDAALASDEVKWSPVWIAILHGDFSTWPAPASAGTEAASPSPKAGLYEWLYVLFDKDSHEVVSHGASTQRFDTSMLHLPGRTRLGDL